MSKPKKRKLTPDIAVEMLQDWLDDNGFVEDMQCKSTGPTKTYKKSLGPAEAWPQLHVIATVQISKSIEVE